MSPYKSVSDKEEEYFARQEAEKLRRLADEAKKATEEAEKKRLKELHYMSCPKCGMGLTEIVFREIKIDKCFSCEGVWLDGGELEQVLDTEKGVSVLIKFASIFKKSEK